MRWIMGRGVSALFVVFLFATTAFSQAAAGAYTIVALPDTQIYSKSYPNILAAQTQWIADHKTDMNIQLVVGLGDIVDAGGRIYQWQNADAAYRTLDGAGVPYVAAIGNHDYDANNPAGRTTYTKNFNSYFGPARYVGKSYYMGSYPAGSNENFYSVLQLGGRQYLVLVLEVFPRDEALNWAAGVLAANTDKRVIVVTHAYTYYDNMRMSKCDSNSSYSFGVGQDNDGEDVWNKLVSKYANVELVLSGHVVQGDGTGRRTDIGANGNLVNEILSDYQSWANGGNGYLRLITVDPVAGQISVKTYSPYLNQYLTDSHNQFTVPYSTNGNYAGTSMKITGKVKSAIDCSALSGVTVSIGSTVTTTDSYGKFSIPATAGVPLAMTAKRSGWGSVTKVASAVPGQASPAKFLMASSGVLKGKVLSPAGASLSGATVTVKGGALKITKSVTTDAYGNFSTSWIPVGTYTVGADLTGYQGASATATVSTGATTTLQLTMQ